LRPTFAGQQNASSPSLTLKVSAKSRQVDRASLIIKAIASPPQTSNGGITELLPTTYVRRAVDVTIGTLDLEVDGSSDIAVAPDVASIMHPFPNRLTRYRLGLVNHGPGERKMKVRVLIPYSAVQLAGLSQQSIDDLVANSASSVGKESLFTVPPDGRVHFATPDEGAEAEPAAAPDAATASQAGGAQEGDRPAPSNDRLLTYGLLVEVSDADNPLYKFVRYFRVVPQRPRRYVRPRVYYNSQLERIEVLVAPRQVALLPPDAVKITCDIAGAIAAEIQGKRQAVLDADHPQAKLFINVPAVPPRTVTLYLNIDDYPRAFVYRVPCGAQSVDLPEAADLMDARLANINTTGTYQKPSVSTPIKLELDAPVGSFEAGGDFVLLDVDDNFDDQLDTTSAIRLSTDRQVHSYLQSWADGALSLDTRVSDFNVPLPTDRLENVRVNVLSQFGNDRLDQRFAPLGLNIDGRPPRIHRVAIRPASRWIVAGTDFDVIVWASDEMSGVKSVEVAFDETGAGEFTPESKPIKAVFDPFTHRWTTKVPTADILGPQVLLVRATDQVGNSTNALEVKLHVMSQEQVPLVRATQTKILKGVVKFNGRPVQAAELTLTSADGTAVGTIRSDDQGSFVFVEVPPGKYVVAATGVVFNVPYRARREFALDPESGRVVHADLELQ
jgi:hypothetical protein